MARTKRTPTNAELEELVRLIPSKRAMLRPKLVPVLHKELEAEKALDGSTSILNRRRPFRSTSMKLIGKEFLVIDDLAKELCDDIAAQTLTMANIKEKVQEVKYAFAFLQPDEIMKLENNLQEVKASFELLLDAIAKLQSKGREVIATF